MRLLNTKETDTGNFDIEEFIDSELPRDQLHVPLYGEADVCYAYLADVTSESHPDARWFVRGWTLQELIAPSTVAFFDKGWRELGTKESLQQVGIPVDILLGEEDLETANIAQRMSWAAKRQTTRIEDRAYSLLGIFGINMPLIYGEGKRAFVILQEEIMKVMDDQSVFAWKSEEDSDGGLLATSPDPFQNSGNIITYNPFLTSATGPLTVGCKEIYMEPERSKGKRLIAIYLRDLSMTMQNSERVQCESVEYLDIDNVRPSQYPIRSICVQQPRLTRQRTNQISSKYRTKIAGHRAVTRLLIETGKVDLDSMDAYGQTLLTPLFRAIENGHNAVVQVPLERDVNLESKDQQARHPWY